jgi:glycosyltransferase involved in cell wall biosynthesis
MTNDKRWFLTEEFDSSQYDKNINWPKISIVTPTYNYGHLIEETILSVIKQNYPNLEYIVIDGNSKDNTVDMIKKYEDHISYWISEKDTGQPSAINKGIAKCTGEIFNWLNSDDYLEKGALYTIAKTFVDSKADVVAGKVRYFDEKDYEETIPNQVLSAQGVMCWEENVKFIQPGVWMKLDNLRNIDGVDEDQKMRFAFDWDMIVRYLCFFPKVAYTPELLVHYRLHAVSNTVSDPSRYGVEEAYIIEKIATNPKYSSLHKACKYKTDRRNWNLLLTEATGDNASGRIKKVMRIISNIDKQPWKNGVPRMTLGAVKQILLKSNSTKN